MLGHKGEKPLLILYILTILHNSKSWECYIKIYSSIFLNDETAFEILND